MNWLKQTSDNPAFPALEWSRPEHKGSRGKLLVIGGNGHSFTTTSQVYTAAQAAGAGSVRVILPASLEKSLARVFPEAEFAMATPSGSFGRGALATIMEAANWADGVVLAGDFGRNSETNVMIESFVQKYTGLLTLSGDSLTYFYNNSDLILQRSKTCIVGELIQLQKILSGQILIKHSMDLLPLIEELAKTKTANYLLTKHLGQAVLAADGQISTTPVKISLPVLAAYAAVWWLQQPLRPFEAITTSIYFA